MKRIGLLYDHILDVGGVESHLLSLIRRSDPACYQFVLFSRTSTEYQKEIHNLGVPVVETSVLSAFNPKTILALVNYFKSWDIDLVHIHGTIAAIPGRIAARILNLPVVVTFHSPARLYHGTQQTLRARFGRWFYTHLDQFLNLTLSTRLIYVSKRIYQEEMSANRAPKGISTVINNGIDISRFNPGPNRVEQRLLFGAAPGSIVITFVGRLDEHKGIDLLIETFSRLPVEFAPLELWIVGSGHLYDDFVEKARSLRLENIRFMGKRSDIPDILAASDIFVLPSRLEGMSVSLLEAMAAGLPCIVTDVGDNRYLIENGNSGWIIPPDSLEELLQSLESLIKDASLREKMSLAARNNSLNYSDIKTARLVQDIYAQSLH